MYYSHKELKQHIHITRTRRRYIKSLLQDRSDKLEQIRANKNVLFSIRKRNIRAEEYRLRIIGMHLRRCNSAMSSFAATLTKNRKERLYELWRDRDTYW